MLMCLSTRLGFVTLGGIISFISPTPVMRYRADGLLLLP